jgi:hypothetical protein
MVVFVWVNGSATLQVYQDPEGGDFFLPFVDATAPEETYGAGRYLDVEAPRDGKFLIDFNYAYNPYCAYNDKWSCPIPPKENRLKVQIEAGEKNFKMIIEVTIASRLTVTIVTPKIVTTVALIIKTDFTHSHFPLHYKRDAVPYKAALHCPPGW